MVKPQLVGVNAVQSRALPALQEIVNCSGVGAFALKKSAFARLRSAVAKGVIATATIGFAIIAAFRMRLQLKAVNPMEGIIHEAVPEFSQFFCAMHRQAVGGTQAALPSPLHPTAQAFAQQAIPHCEHYQCQP